jgi:cytochrome P450
METLRLGNTAPTTIPHYTLKDTSMCGYRVPKDTVVLLNLQAMHKDPKNWENPDVFDPHRHLDSDGQLAKQSPNLLPFSAGRRVCAGEPLAKIELFLFLSCMLQKFTFVAEEGKPPPPIKAIKGLTNVPVAYKIRAIKRQ